MQEFDHTAVAPLLRYLSHDILEAFRRLRAMAIRRDRLRAARYRDRNDRYPDSAGCNPDCRARPHEHVAPMETHENPLELSTDVSRKRAGLLGLDSPNNLGQASLHQNIERPAISKVCVEPA